MKYIALLLLGLSTSTYAEPIRGGMSYTHGGGGSGGPALPPPPTFQVVSNERRDQLIYLNNKITSLQSNFEKMHKISEGFKETVDCKTDEDMSNSRKVMNDMLATLNESINSRNDMQKNGASNRLLRETDENIEHFRRKYLRCEDQYNAGYNNRVAERKKQEAEGYKKFWDDFIKNNKEREAKLEIARKEGLKRELERTEPIDLDKIPDPNYMPCIDLGDGYYSFKSKPGEFRTKNEKLYKNLDKIPTFSEKRITAKTFGLISTQQADRAYSLNNEADAEFYHELGKGFLDIAIGIDPVTGMARSTYELLTGKNLVTGAELSGVERSIAFVGVITAGTGRTLTQTTRVMTRIYEGAQHLLTNHKLVETAIREGGALAGRVEPILHGITKNHRITGIRRAEEANVSYVAQGWRRPYQDGSHVVDFVTVRESNWFRVHTETNQAGSWVLKRSAIQGLTPEQIRLNYALPALPTHVSEVRIPSGTRMTRGSVQYHAMDDYLMPTIGPHGAIQYQIENMIPRESFTNMRAIGERFQ